MADVPYRRLGASVYAVGSVFSLWLGGDHVLQVTASFGIENYRRWYLREIQAVIVRDTGRRTIWNLVWGIFAGVALAAGTGFLGLASTSNGGEQVALYVFAGIAGAFAAACSVMLLWNSLLGPTCAVYVQTPSGLPPLAAPARRRAAEAFLADLRPAIEAAQSPEANPNPA
jgi:hypothetical protein